MKSLLSAVFLGMICTTQVFAGYEVIGETKECTLKTKVLRRITASDDTLLVIHDRDVYTMPFVRQVGGVKYYSSLTYTGQYNKFITFEAAIMAPQMSRLSYMRIYLSGVMMDCYIDK